jgi:arylsulfatase A
MKNRPFVLFGVAVLAALIGSSLGAKQKTRPNLIIILADDLGYTDLGCYWDLFFTKPRPDVRPAEVRPRIDTPNIDRMAQEGVMFTDFHVGAPVCSASRAALLTACYPPRIGFSGIGPRHNGVLGPRSRAGLSPDEVTLAELLKANGYATMCIGKWHLGDVEPFLPTQQGFDDYYGPMFMPKGKPTLVMHDEAVVDSLQVAQLTDRYTNKAIRFIRAHKDKPFFLYLAHNMPHVPLGVAPSFRNKSSRGLYGDVVMQLDSSTGQIVKLLEHLGIAKRTLVVFLSDNGAWQGSKTDGGQSLPLRHGKGAATEGGFRVPCVMWWPGRLPAHPCNQLAASMDIMPTFAHLIGADMPRHTLDGTDITPLLLEPGSPSPRDAFYYYCADTLKAVRSGPWKLFFKHRKMADRPGFLYNLHDDIGEHIDVAADHTDVVRRLAAMADSVRTELGDIATGAKGTGCREPGRVDQPSHKIRK